MKRWIAWIIGAAVAAGGVNAKAWAGTTQVTRDGSFAVFQRGEFDAVALSSDGYLYPTYARTTIGDTGTEIVWSALAESGGGVLCATGHDGKLVRLREDKDPEIIADLEAPELTAMVRLDDGSALIAAAPSGVIYRLAGDDKLTTYATVESKFIWEMEKDDSGAIWAAAGAGAKLYKIQKTKNEIEVKVACEFSSQNIIDLWIDREGKIGDKGLIYAAGQNPGWLYRYRDGDQEATVVYNAETDEIRAIQSTQEGLAIAINTERAPSPQALNLTLRMAGALPSSSGAGSPAGSNGKKDSPAMGDVFKPSGVKSKKGPRSAVVLLTADGFTRELWVSPERPIHSLGLTPAGNLLIAAGNKGRLFEVQFDGTFALVADTKEDYLVRIVSAENGWLLTAARNGLVYRMDHGRATESQYRSRVIDAGAPVRWGRFYWRGQAGDGQKISVAFRQGNSDNPKKGNWEKWSREREIGNGKSARISDETARYLQYRLTFKQKKTDPTPLKTDYVEAFYQRPNGSPRIKTVKVSEAGSSRPSKSGGSSSSSSASSRTSARASAPRPSSSPRASISSAAAKVQGGGRKPNSNTGNLNVTWSAEDPNGDNLVYSVYFKADDENEWKLIEDELRTTRLPLPTKGVSDGRYRFRVTATDEFANPPGDGRDAAMVSDEVTIDNTAPVIEGLKVRPSGRRARLTFTVADDLSLISSIQIDIDNGDAYPIFPTDGFFDQSEETVDWTSLKLEKGEHVITLAVTDRRGNTAVDKVVFEIEDE